MTYGASVVLQLAGAEYRCRLSDEVGDLRVVRELKLLHDVLALGLAHASVDDFDYVFNFTHLQKKTWILSCGSRLETDCER